MREYCARTYEPGSGSTSEAELIAKAAQKALHGSDLAAASAYAEDGLKKLGREPEREARAHAGRHGLFDDAQGAEEGEVQLRVLHRSALGAAGRVEEAERAAADTRARVEELARAISDDTLRQSFFANVPENRDALAT